MEAAIYAGIYLLALLATVTAFRFGVRIGYRRGRDDATLEAIDSGATAATHVVDEFLRRQGRT